jgi:protein-tyrosine phosphatase
MTRSLVDNAQLVIALKEAERRPLLELRFPEMAERVTYCRVDGIDVAEPVDVIAMIDWSVGDLIHEMQRAASTGYSRGGKCSS